MTKYITLFKCSLTAQMIFRFNFFIEYFSKLIRLMVKIFLWQAIVMSLPKGSDISIKFIVTYFVFAFIIEEMTGADTQIAAKIKAGTLSNDLLKPVNVVGLEFSRVVAEKLMTVVKFIPAMVAILLIYHRYVMAPDINIWVILLVLLGFVVNFFIMLTLHVIAFWVTEVYALGFVILTFFGIFSGNLIPYEFLPDSMKMIFELLPFKFLIHIPVNAVMGRLDTQHIYICLLQAAGYIGIFSLVNYLLFRNGIKKYTSMGG